jgi:hypothetical protein
MRVAVICEQFRRMRDCTNEAAMRAAIAENVAILNKETFVGQ